jgi:hypothetical protein
VSPLLMVILLFLFNFHKPRFFTSHRVGFNTSTLILATMLEPIPTTVGTLTHAYLKNAIMASSRSAIRTVRTVADIT